MPLAFEAAVAGGIPVIKALREGLAGNRILRIAGILNGTCNYILTQMRERGREFAEVLADAQKPATPKQTRRSTSTASMRHTSWRSSPPWRSVDRSRSRPCMSRASVRSPRSTSRSPTSLAIASSCSASHGTATAGIEARVHPCMVPQSAPIARVDGVFNAVVAEGDFVGRVMLEGRGAGAGPTASAVVADLIDIARNRRHPGLGRRRPNYPMRPLCQ